MVAALSPAPVNSIVRPQIWFVHLTCGKEHPDAEHEMLPLYHCRDAVVLNERLFSDSAE
jgi:hypothetical protein